MHTGLSAARFGWSLPGCNQAVFKTASAPLSPHAALADRGLPRSGISSDNDREQQQREPYAGREGNALSSVWRVREHTVAAP